MEFINYALEHWWGIPVLIIGSIFALYIVIKILGFIIELLIGDETSFPVVNYNYNTSKVSVKKKRRNKTPIKRKRKILAPVGGTIIRYSVDEGTLVEEDTVVLVIKAKKNEWEVKTLYSGIINFLVPIDTRVFAQDTVAQIIPPDNIMSTTINSSETYQFTQNNTQPSSAENDELYYNIIKNIIDERGFSLFDDYSKCKSLLQDYTAGRYKKENRLLLVSIEAGCPGEIASSSEVDITRNILINKLHNDYSMDKNAAEKIINLLYKIKNEEKK